MKTYRLMECNYNDVVVHTDDLDLESAQELLDRYTRIYSDLQFWIEEY
jgi:hypothetical protein